MLQCDKCLQKHENPSRIGRRCNRGQDRGNEPTGYCQGTLRPVAQFVNGAWVDPGPGHKNLEHNQ